MFAIALCSLYSARSLIGSDLVVSATYCNQLWPNSTQKPPVNFITWILPILMRNAQ